MIRKLIPLLAGAALVVAGCATEADDAHVVTGAAAVALVRAAPDAAADASTGRFEVTIEVTGADATGHGPFRIESSGAFDRTAGQATFTMDLGDVLGQVAADLPGADEPMRIVLDGDTAYLRAPLLDQLTGTSGWLVADAATVDQLGGSGVVGSATSDPSSVLEVLRGVSGDDLTVVGTEPVRGVTTTHYQTTIDLTAALDQVPSEHRRAVQDQLDSLGAAVGALPVDVWVDAEGLAHRLTITAAMDGPAGGAVQTSIDVEVFDYGEPVDIVVPDPSEVTPAGAVLGGFAGLFGGTGS